MTSPYLMYNIASPLTNIWQTHINKQYLHSKHFPSAGNKLAYTVISHYSHGYICKTVAYMKMHKEFDQAIRDKSKRTKAHTQTLESWWQNRFLMTDRQQTGGEFTDNNKIKEWMNICGCFIQINKFFLKKVDREVALRKNSFKLKKVDIALFLIQS